MKYPDILGIHLKMPVIEFDDVISKLGYQPIKLVENSFDDTWFYVESKISCQHTLEIMTKDDYIKWFTIKNWREFFGFDYFNMDFDNVAEILLSYFLKDFEYESRFWFGTGTNEYYTNEWVLWVTNHLETITFRLEDDKNDCIS